MFFFFTESIWSLASPLNLTVIGLCLGTILLWSPWRRFGVWLISLITVSLLAVAVLPIGAWLLAPLSGLYRPYNPAAGTMSERVTGIVLLSGDVVSLRISRQVGHVVPGHAADRVVEFIRLVRALPKARLLICGGNVEYATAGGKNWPRESILIADYLVSQGIPRDRLLVEDGSRDTHENAVLAAKLAQPRSGERWLLVTSAWHMPRTRRHSASGSYAPITLMRWPVGRTISTCDPDAPELMTGVSITGASMTVADATTSTGRNDPLRPSSGGGLKRGSRSHLKTRFAFTS